MTDEPRRTLCEEGDHANVRETTVTVYGASRTVRTTQDRGSITRLERAHTRAVIAALEELHTTEIDRQYAEELHQLEGRQWPDTEGFPGSGESARQSVVKDAAEHHTRRRIRRFKPPQSAWTAARRPWTPPGPVAEIPASVRHLHEQVTPEAV